MDKAANACMDASMNEHLHVHGNLHVFQRGLMCVLSLSSMARRLAVGRDVMRCDAMCCDVLRCNVLCCDVLSCDVMMATIALASKGS